MPTSTPLHPINELVQVDRDIPVSANISVEIVRDVDDVVLKAINTLLPQLSKTSSPLDKARLNEIANSPANCLIIAKKDCRIVGALTLVTITIPTGKRAWIEDVVVNEQDRGFGIGMLLTQHAIQIAQQNEVKSIDLTSRPSRVVANKMYQRAGFSCRDTNIYRYTNGK